MPSTATGMPDQVGVIGGLDALAVADAAADRLDAGVVHVGEIDADREAEQPRARRSPSSLPELLVDRRNERARREVGRLEAAERAARAADQERRASS